MMTDEWLTYAQAAERLNLTVEAVRLRALRGRWQKTIGNDKRPRVRLPEGWSNDGRTTDERRERKPRNDGRTTVERTVDPALVTALEGHVQTLKADVERLEALLAAERARTEAAEGRASEESAKTAQAIAALTGISTHWRPHAPGRGGGDWWVEARPMRHRIVCAAGL
jgi:hypothetical protein